MHAGSITIVGNETGLGVNLYGNLEATQNVLASSLGDLFYGNVNAGGSVRMHASGEIRQYGDLTAVQDVSVSGEKYTLYLGQRLETAADVDIQSDGSVVIAGEVSGRNIDLGSGAMTNNGFILADERLLIDAEQVSQQREIATEYDIYLDPALQQYLQAYQYQLLQGGERADIAAQLISRASEHEIISQHIQSGATMSGKDIEMRAEADITNTGGAMVATNDMLLSAGANIINEYLQLRRLLKEKDGCPLEDCGYRVDFHAAELLAGNDLTVIAGGNFENRASDVAAGGMIRVQAGVDIVNSLTSSNHEVHERLSATVASTSCRQINRGGDETCTTTYTTEPRGYLLDEVNVLSPARIVTLYGDIRLIAGRDFVSIGSETSAGGELAVEAGERAILSGFVDAEEDFVQRREHNYETYTIGKGEYGTRTVYENVTYKGTELITATSNLVGTSVSIGSGGDMILTGVRLLASRDLDLTSTSGSILIDSTHLPSEAELPEDETVRFVELESDVVEQIFGRSGDTADSDLDATDDGSAQDYLNFLRNSELLTAVEALRRAGSGADIKDTVRGVGMQSYVSLVGDDSLQSLREDARDAINTIYETIEVDIRTHNNAVAEYHAALRRKLNEAGALSDADETQTAEFIRQQVTAVDTAAAVRASDVQIEYQAQLAANQAQYGHLLQETVKRRYWDGNYGKNGAWRSYTTTVPNQHYVSLKNAADAQAAADRDSALAAIESQRLLDVALIRSADTDEGLHQLITQWTAEFTAQIAVYAEQKTALAERLSSQVHDAMRIAETLRLEELELQSVREKLVAEGSIEAGEPSLAMALTHREFPQLERVPDLSINENGIVENRYEHEVERTRIVTETRDTGTGQYVENNRNGETAAGDQIVHTQQGWRTLLQPLLLRNRTGNPHSMGEQHRRG